MQLRGRVIVAPCGRNKLEGSQEAMSLSNALRFMPMVVLEGDAGGNEAGLLPRLFDGNYMQANEARSMEARARRLGMRKNDKSNAIVARLHVPADFLTSQKAPSQRSPADINLTVVGKLLNHANHVKSHIPKHNAFFRELTALIKLHKQSTLLNLEALYAYVVDHLEKAIFAAFDDIHRAKLVNREVLISLEKKSHNFVDGCLREMSPHVSDEELENVVDRLKIYLDTNPAGKCIGDVITQRVKNLNGQCTGSMNNAINQMNEIVAAIGPSATGQKVSFMLPRGINYCAIQPKTQKLLLSEMNSVAMSRLSSAARSGVKLRNLVQSLQNWDRWIFKLSASQSQNFFRIVNSTTQQRALRELAMGECTSDENMTLADDEYQLAVTKFLEQLKILIQVHFFQMVGISAAIPWEPLSNICGFTWNFKYQEFDDIPLSVAAKRHPPKKNAVPKPPKPKTAAELAAEKMRKPKSYEDEDLPEIKPLSYEPKKDAEKDKTKSEDDDDDSDSDETSPLFGSLLN